VAVSSIADYSINPDPFFSKKIWMFAVQYPAGLKRSIVLDRSCRNHIQRSPLFQHWLISIQNLPVYE